MSDMFFIPEITHRPRVMSCPFCGKKPTITLLDENRLDSARYTCKTINCAGNDVWVPFYLWIRRIYPPEVQAVLDAAKTLEKYETVDYPGITSWNDAVDVLIEAVRDLKESGAQDEA